jgi:hypothetical protein
MGIADILSGGTSTPPFVADGSTVPDAGPIVGMSGSPTATAAGNPPGNPNVAPPAHQSPWEAILKGALVGLSGVGKSRNFTQGLAAGAASELADARNTEQVNLQKQQLQFESARAADSHIEALAQIRAADDAHEEHRMVLATQAANIAAYNKTMGIEPSVTVSGTDSKDLHAQASGGLSTLANRNGGTIPAVTVVNDPHTTVNGGKQTITAFAPSPQEIQQNASGYRKLVDDARRVQGLPPTTDQEWNTGGGMMVNQGPMNGLAMQAQQLKGQQQMVHDAQQKLYTVPQVSGDPQKDAAVSANLQQQLVNYQKDPNADPAVVKLLTGQLASFDSAVADNQKKANAAKVQTIQATGPAEAKAAGQKAGAEANARVAAEGSPAAIAAARAKSEAEAEGKIAADQKAFGNITDPFGVKVGVDANGRVLDRKEMDASQKTFNKEFIQPLTVLQKTTMEFQRINSNPNQTGAEKVTALLNAVGISGDPLKGKGFRISNDIINEHAQARNIWEGAVQKLNNVVGSGGPITSKQIADYTAVAEGVVHDAYVTAAQEARRQGIGVDFLPKPTQQGQVPDKLTAKIYLDVAQGNVDAAHKALLAAGYK